jgi:pentose-5-phosphate-3-epimerase
MKIIPSLVEQSAKDLFDKIIFLSPYYTQFQIDIEDGVFIKNKTLSIDEFVSHVKVHPSPLLRSTVYDFHFMSVDYERSIELLCTIKGLIHIDAVFIHTTLHPNVESIQKIDPAFRVGLVINPEENIENTAKEFSLNSVPLIQLMTINPGPQGQSFIPEALNKIDQLKKMGFLGKIYIDGAVNEKSVPLMKALPHPPDVLCPGSYLAKSPLEDLTRRVEFLKE